MREYEEEVSKSNEENERQQLMDITFKTEANEHRTGTLYIILKDVLILLQLLDTAQQIKIK